MVASTILCNSSLIFCRQHGFIAIICAVLFTTLLCIRFRFCSYVPMKIEPALKIRSRRVVQKSKHCRLHPCTRAFHCQFHCKDAPEVCFACCPFVWLRSFLSGVKTYSNGATWTWHRKRPLSVINSFPSGTVCIHIFRRTPTRLHFPVLWHRNRKTVRRKIRCGCLGECGWKVFKDTLKCGICFLQFFMGHQFVSRMMRWNSNFHSNGIALRPRICLGMSRRVFSWDSRGFLRYILTFIILVHHPTPTLDVIFRLLTPGSFLQKFMSCG